MRSDRWEPLRYQSVIPWGQTPVPLIPAAIRGMFGDESAPLPDVLLEEFHLCVRDLDGSFWVRGVKLNSTELEQILAWVQTRLPAVATASLVEPGLSKRVEIASLALPTDQLRVLSETLASSDIIGADIRFEKLLHQYDFQSRSLSKLACLLECTQPHPLDAHYSTRPSSYDTRNSLATNYALTQVTEPGQTRSVDTYLSGNLNQRDLEVEESQKVRNALQSLYDVVEDPRIFEILYGRTLALGNKKPLGDFAKEFGLPEERVKKIEHGARYLLHRAKSQKYQILRRKADRLRTELGVAIKPYSPRFQREVSLAVGDLSDPKLNKFGRHVFVWLAGPYRNHDDWLLSNKKVLAETVNAFAEAADSQKFLSMEVIQRTLASLEIQPEFHESWLAQFSEFVATYDEEGNRGFLFCQGPFLDRVEVLLNFHKRPFSVEEIGAVLGRRHPRGLRFRLMNDGRFWRINKQADFVRAGTPGYRKYIGITKAIEQEIMRSGGRATVTQIVDRLTTDYQVTPGSVFAYLNTDYFRIHPVTKVVKKVTEPTVEVRVGLPRSGRCYYLDNRWFWRITVNKDWLRGSGRTCPNAFALTLGCKPGTQLKLPSLYGDIAVGWKLHSPTGAHLGSLKKVINSMELQQDDHVFVGFKDGTMEFRGLRASQIAQAPTPFAKLALSIGLTETSDIESQNWTLIGRVLGMEEETVSQEQVMKHLMKRRDKELVLMTYPQYMDV